MAGAIGTAFVEVKPDVSKFKGEAEHGILGPLRGVATAAAGIFAGIEIGSFLKDAATHAADLQLQVFRAGQIFHGASGQVQEFARTAAESLGLSEHAALTATTKFGQLFTNIGIQRGKAAEMSTTLVKLAADLSAFTGIDVDTVVQSLLRGETGMTRGLKSLGVSLTEAQVRQEAFDQGLTRSTKDVLTPAQRAQAIYALVLRETANAQGTFAQRSGTLQGQIKLLSAQFDDMKDAVGARLLPALLRAMQVLSADAPKAFAQVGAATRTVASDVTGFENALGPIPGLIGAAAASIGQFVGVGGLLALVGGFKAAGAAAAVFESNIALSIATNPAGKIAGLFDALKGAGSSLNVAGLAAAGLGFALYKLVTNETLAESAAHNLRDALEGLRDAERKAADAALAHRSAQLDQSEATTEAKQAHKDVRQAIIDRNAAEEHLSIDTARRTRTIRDANATDQQRHQLAEIVKRDQKDLSDKTAAVTTAYQRLNRANLDVASAQLRVKTTADDVRDAQSGATKASTDAAKKMRDFGAAAEETGRREAVHQRALVGDIGALGAQGKALELARERQIAAAKALDTFTGGLNSMKGHFAPVASALADYAAKLGHIPPKKVTDVVLNAVQANASIDQILARLNAIRHQTLDVTVIEHHHGVGVPTAGHARGGFIGGPRGAGDVVPAWLSPGEVVLNEDEQRDVGMDRITSALARHGARFSRGGVARFMRGGVATLQAGGAPAPAPTGGGGGASGSTAGRQTADEILLAFLNQLRSQLPKAWKQALQDMISRTADAIRSQQSTLDTAFGAMNDKAFQAFDARTQANLDKVGSQFDDVAKVVDDAISGGVNSVDLTASITAQFKALPGGVRAALKDAGVTAATEVAAINATIAKLPQHTQDVLRQGAAGLKTAFDTDMAGIDQTLSAANDATDKHLAEITARWNQWQKDSDAATDAWAKGQTDAVNAALKGTLASIDAWQKSLTPTEQVIANEKAAHDAAAAQQQLADAQAAVADAQKQLSDAQAAGDDPQAILDAQKAVADAQRQLDEVNFEQTLAQQQAQADTERAQRDQQAQDQRDAADANAQAQIDQINAQAQAERDAHAANAQAQIDQAQADADAARAAAQATHDQDAAARQAAYDADQAALAAAHDAIVAELQRQQTREETEYQASRNLLRDHLAARLTAIEHSIETESDGWKRHHAAIMKVLHGLVPDYKQSGSELGQAFVTGLQESEHAVEGMAEALARAIAKYLKLHSPAEEGPLASLDTWWRPLAPTLISGVDHSSIDHAMRRLSTPPQTRYGAVGDPSVVAKLDELIRAVKTRAPADVTAVVHADDARRLLSELSVLAGG